MSALTPAARDRAKALRDRLKELEKAIASEAISRSAQIESVLPRHRTSARNLAHYLGLRHQDLRRLQIELGAIGLSSLGRCEGHVENTLVRLGAWLSGELGDAVAPPADGDLCFERAGALLHANTQALFGARPPNRHVYIMVTAPEGPDATAAWADGVLAAGADILRVNAVHGDHAEWSAMADLFRSRATAMGRSVRVIVDLPGPKLRTEVREPARAVVHLPRHKDRLGRTVAPTVLTLVGRYKDGADIPIPEGWLPEMKVNDTIDLIDSGGRERVLVIRTSDGRRAQATCERSLYVTPRLPLTWRRNGRVLAEGRVGHIPPGPGEVVLEVGTQFLLTSKDGHVHGPVPTLFLAQPALLDQVNPGERVLLDDGRILAVVDAKTTDGVRCSVRHAAKSPIRLRSDKGISFPDSELHTPGLGPEDDAILTSALEFADGVEASFVNTAEDVAGVRRKIEGSGKSGFGMILKLETRSAMLNLPDILFEAMKYHPVGLMIARGDLAVELSFERLAEMQEELLWFGEACHLPVIWATQVLDSVAHSGVPTRAEVTDAAMAMRAECVMLNRGPFITTATRMLDDIICKMEAHQYKKRSLYRQLSLGRGG